MRWLFALALLGACGSETSSEDATPGDTGADAGSDPMDAASRDADPIDAEPVDSGADAGVLNEQLPPTIAADLRTWLSAGSYAGWAAESGPHDSDGPHFGTVRTFINAALDESLRNGNTEHPMGSAAIKELYGSGTTIRGWSVMVKTEAGSGGARWWWYERYGTSTYASSQGDPTCVPCHSMGSIDFFLSPYPLQ